MKKKIMLLAVAVLAISTFTLCTKSADVEPSPLSLTNVPLGSSENEDLDRILKNGITSKKDFQLLIDMKIEPFGKLSSESLKRYKNDLVFDKDLFMGTRGDSYKFIESELMSISEKEFFLFFSILVHNNIIIENSDGSKITGPVFYDNGNGGEAKFRIMKKEKCPEKKGGVWDCPACEGTCLAN